MKSSCNHSSLKLSKEFAARLASLPPNEKLNAVVLLEVKHEKGALHRQTHGQRRAVIDALREIGGPIIVEMDHILEKCGGRRLDDKVTALGTVAVEATPGGIRVLADLKDVKTILEDQKISLLSADLK